MRFVITGGYGFIFKHFVKLAIEEGHTIHNIDNMTYCSDRTFVDNIVFNDAFCGRFPYHFLKSDINDITKIPLCDVLIHTAAESDVDSSIGDNESFIHTNINGTRNLLEVVRKMPVYERPLFVHISSDEVAGDNKDGWLKEDSPLKPSSPYAASKAASELLVTSWSRTYGIDYLIVRPSNNYGVGQYYSKLIPKTIFRFNQGKNPVVHGNGKYTRCWTHTEDTCKAVMHLIKGGYKNDVFNITTQYELSNLEVIDKIAKVMGKDKYECEYVNNRPGQDIRYGSDGSKLLSIGFKFEKDFDVELKNIVKYKYNEEWSVTNKD